MTHMSGTIRKSSGGGFAENRKEINTEERVYNMKEFITKDEYGSTVILKFSDTPNKKVEDNILEMLVRTYEDRLDVSSKLDGAEKG